MYIKEKDKTIPDRTSWMDGEMEDEWSHGWISGWTGMDR